MEPNPLAAAVQTIDQRLSGVEQILPTLATKEDLSQAVAKLATKEELREAVAKLAIKDELRQLKDDLELKIKDEGEASRRYMKVLVEEIKDHIDIYAERVTAVDERDAREHAESVEAAQTLDRRVTALEARQSSRRRRQTS